MSVIRPIAAAAAGVRRRLPIARIRLPFRQPRLRSVLETLLLAAAALCGNAFGLTLFFGVDVLFGSIAALIAVARLGLLAGAVVAVAGGAYTLVLWSHPYALLIFALEALAVGLHRRWAQQRGRPLPPLAVSVALYWLVIGIPLVLLFYHGPLGMGWVPTLLIAVKQSLNGILNAALAGGLMVGAALLLRQHALPRLTDLLFSLLLTAMLVPALLVTAWENADLKHQLEADRALELGLFGTVAADSLEKVAGTDPPALAETLARLQRIARGKLRAGAEPRLYLAERRSGTPTLGDAQPAGEVTPGGQPGLTVVLPAVPHSSAMMRWRASRYRWTAPVAGTTPPQNLVIETSTVPVIDALQRHLTKLLTALLALGLGAVGLAHVLSRRIVAPLAAVADAARALPAAIRERRTWQAPTPGLFAEAGELGWAVRGMGDSLDRSFSDLQRERDEQARQRALLDLEAQSLARLVRDGEDATAFADVLCRQLSRVLPGQHCLLLPGTDNRLELVAGPGLSPAMREALRQWLAAPAVDSFLRQVLASGETAALPVDLLRGHGELASMPCSAQVIPIRDREERGQAVLLTDAPLARSDAFAAEVLERVRTLAGLGFPAIWLRRHHGVLLEALSQSGTGIVVARRSGRDHLVSYANRGFAQLSGYAAAALHGQDLRMLRDGDDDQPDLAQLRAALAADESCRAVIRNRRPDGSTYWNALALSPVKSEGGTLTHYIGVQQDVTDTVEAMARLRASEARLNDAQAIAHVGSWEVDLSTGAATWSNETYRLLGYEPGAVPPSVENALARLHPDDRPHVEAALAAAQQPPFEDYDVQYRVRGADGVERIQRARGRVQLDAAGTPTRLAGTALDVTDAAAFTQRLRASEARLNEAQAIAHLGSWAYEADPRGTWSAEAYRLLGYAPDAVPATLESFYAAVHPDDLPQVRARVKAALTPPHEDFQVEFRTAAIDGVERMLLARGRVQLGSDGELVRFAGTALDVTEQRRTEHTLREQEARYRLVVDNLEDLLVRVDTQGRFEFVSPSYCRLFGRSEAELLGQTFMPLVHPDDRADTAAAMRALFAPPHVATMEQRVETVRGQRWLQWSDKAVLDEQGQVTAIVGVGRDVTERKAAEAALRASERRFRRLFESIGEGVIYCDSDGIVTDANPAASMLLGVAPAALVGSRPEAQPWQVLREDGTPSPMTEYPLRRAIETGADTEPEVLGVVVGGEVRWLLVTAHAESAPDAGHPHHQLFVTFTDITRLLEVRHRLQAIIDSSPHGIVEVDAASKRVLWCNDAMGRLFGYTRDELIGLHIDALHPPDSQAEIVADLADSAADAAAAGMSAPLYVPCLRRDGSRFSCRIAPGVMQLGQTRTLTAFFTDVSVEYASRRALEESRQALLNAQALAHIGSWEYDIPRNHLVWSPEVYRIFEQDPQHFAASFEAFQKLVHPADRAEVARQYRAALAQDKEYDCVHRLLLADRRVKWVHERATFEHDAEGHALRALGTVQDITARRLAEQRLEESREQLRTVFDNAPIGMALLDQGGRMLMVNRALARLLDRDSEDLLGERADNFAHPEDQACDRRRLQDLLVGRGDGYRLTKRYLRPEGSLVWADLRMVRLPTAPDAPPAPLAMLEDVTELHHAEQRRRALEQTLSSYTARLEELLDLINLSLPADEQVLALLRLARRALAMGLASLVEVSGGGQTLIAQVSDGDLPAQPPTLPQPLLDATLAQHGRPVSAGGEALGSAAAARGLDHCIALAVTRAGKSADAPEALLLVLWGQQQHSQLNEPSAQLLRLTAQRIAAVRAQQRMERDLVQAKERETIGHLVSGVAHDFNNLLGAIDANLFFLHDSCTQCGGSDAEIEQVLEETRTALDQAKVITSGMLSMSRGGSVPLALVPLGASLGELVGILRHVLPQSITLDVALADGLTAWTNSSFLQAALLNLALNARDAMPGGGDLRIAAAPRYWHGQDSLALGYLAPGECIEVSVSDTGGGIPPHILSRIFEPLFSTKARGRGHGLGLFMVKEFVLRSGAGLVIETATGKGTSFCLLLPAQPPRSRSHTEPVVDAPSPRPERQTAEPSAEADAETDAEAAAPAASLAGLRVLVVEDEPRVREAVGRLLRLGGIEVAFAEHGADALARLREEPPFDLVLTDIAMPVMDGPTLYRQLRNTYPQLPVLMMTGQAGKTAEETAADATVLRKPLEPVEVYTEIRRICRLGTRPTEP